MRKLVISAVAFAFFTCVLLIPQVFAQGWNSTDFLIADIDGQRIAVFDQNLVFRHYLDTTIGGQVWGLTFLQDGRLVAVARATGPNPARIRIYQPDGTIVQDFTDPNIGSPVDIKSDYFDTLFVPQNAPTGIAKYSTSGTFNGTFGSDNFYSNVYLPGGRMWAGNNTSTVTVFDTSSGSQTGTIALDNGQARADSMYFSLSTGTVLMTGGSGFDRVYERTTSGAFIREFVVPAGEFVNFGVTRGPGGDVFATRGFGPPLTVHRWTATGTYVSGTDISANVMTAANIVWAGNSIITAAGVNVSGRVTTSDGRGVYNAVVTLSNPAGSTYAARTNSFGYFTLSNVESGATYVAEVRHKTYRFEPRMISVKDDLAGLTFTPVTAPTAGKLELVDIPTVRKSRK
jgi:hypothetical protein